ncbi:MAG TPA: sigma-70 family RNA polymerase sigma factor [Thermoanaerobaculia bacterium]|nr:sigma-70 family RNA polymerase sigma factor [Thermoanaerobaculia bacterium]
MAAIQRTGPAPQPEHDGLLTAKRSRLVAIVLKFGIPAQDAEDLVQQALLAYLLKADRIRDPDAWLAGAVRRECLQYLRARQRRLYDAIDGALLEVIADPQPPKQEKDQMLRDLDSAIGRTPNRCQRLLELRYGFGFENREIASKLGYQVSSVRKVATRCLAVLCRQLLFTSDRGQGARL